jgi:hypothetical protein
MGGAVSNPSISYPAQFATTSVTVVVWDSRPEVLVILSGYVPSAVFFVVEIFKMTTLGVGPWLKAAVVLRGAPLLS